MDWDNLKIALAISRAGSLTQAAQVLGIDKSTAGRRLSALEADLGTVLFVRTKAGFALTDAGEAAINRAVEVQSRIELLIDEVTRSDEGPVGTVRLLGNAWTLDRLTDIAVPGFLKAHPRLDLRMITRVPYSRVRGEASLALWFEVEPKDGEFTIELGQVPYAVYRSSDTKLRSSEWVSFFDEDESRPIIAQAYRQSRQQRESVRLTATDAAILFTAVKRGAGKGLLPMCLAEADEGLVRVNDGEPELIRTLHLHANHDTVQTLRIQSTIRWLRETFTPAFQPPRWSPSPRNGS
ncbi:LysR family transcriptional regulator [Denitrobaculum tricleocarpae]|uniref:LysR family transcriptional regulator n=1 Tax=Denitrobaculum tricleocarpae TaxID=2591009 RepID=A0A545SY00_9PROT|nr:LysR family transcriptional regulator [Denitrobaculum tricleocarpae]TQV69840.1 LysR family transcriptional regulator [Denitrobaculum tricleocarpae]